MKIENIIFDFDGTIVDSYPGISSAFNKAYIKLYGVENKTELKPHIGPPIQHILNSVNGEQDEKKINQFISFFKEDYDTAGFKLTELYTNMDMLLQDLIRKGYKLYIATNKREKTTKLIANYLSIYQHFSGYYCSDLAGKNYSSKIAMVDDILKSEGLNPHKTILVGDTEHDAIAAKQNGIPFIYAAYGFGDLKDEEMSIGNPMELLKWTS
jgi:phosphoglycolate phosphatase